MPLWVRAVLALPAEHLLREALWTQGFLPGAILAQDFLQAGLRGLGFCRGCDFHGRRDRFGTLYGLLLPVASLRGRTGVSMNGSIVKGLTHLGHFACLPTFVSFTLNFDLQLGHCVFIE